MERLIAFLKELMKELKDDRATGLAAEQSYYYLLALFPGMILILSIIPYLSLSPEQVINTLEELLPAETVSIIEENVSELVINKSGLLLSAGIIGTLWTTSNGMNAFIDSMNIAFDVKDTRSFIITKLLSLSLTIGFILAFITMLLLPVFGSVLIDFAHTIVPIPAETQIVFNVLRWVIAIVVITIFLALLYYFAPAIRYPFKQVVPGALVATIIWLVISLGFSFYVSNFANYSNTYGSLGGVIVLMLWLFYTGYAFVLGGEINALLHRKFASDQKSRLSPTRTM